MSSLYPRGYIEIIDMTGDSSPPLSPLASQSSSTTPSIGQYTQYCRLLQPKPFDNSSRALTGVSGVTSEIRT
jgi:hypothetical protein